MGTPLFDDSAADFARGIDAQIRAGSYVRGEMFARALRESVPAGSRILDYGCGPGRLARMAAEQGHEVLGVDPSEGMVAQARLLPAPSKGTLRFEVGNDASIRARGPFDAIVCSSVVEYVPDPLALLRLFRAALVPTGALIISYANRLSLWRVYASLRFPNAAFRAYQLHLWDSGSFQRLLAEAGFRMTGPARVFESPFDRRPALRRLSGFRLVGTLGIVVARASDGS